MNGMNLNGEVCGSEKAVPGCLGRMVDPFDLTSGMSGNRLLTDKPHNDGSLSRSRSDVSRMSKIGADEMEDNVMVSELKRSSSNNKPYGTAVKLLIAQEMSNDLELRHKSPNVVPKLMGLEALPKQQPDIASRGHLLNAIPENVIRRYRLVIGGKPTVFISRKLTMKFILAKFKMSAGYTRDFATKGEVY